MCFSACSFRWLLPVLLIISTAAHLSAQNTNQPPAELIKQAESGDAKAQYALGLAYAAGQGVAKDDAEAVRWYRKAAEQGDAQAQNKLGNAYNKGEGVAKDETEAVRWYRKAVEQGYANAECNLGMAYATGHGVAKDDAEAVRWFRKAADQGFAQAQTILGWAYGKGEGVPKDEAEAVRWLRKAAEQGFAQAQYILGMAYAAGHGVVKDDAEAVRWYRKAAEQGNADAQYSLGLMYSTGQGIEKDGIEAARWYLKAADQGNVKAKNALAQADIANHQVAAQGNAQKPAWEIPVRTTQDNLGPQLGISDRKLTVVAASHQTNESDYTTSTPQSYNTNCNVYNTSIHCNTSSHGGGTQTHAVYHLQQVVTSNEGGQKVRYVLTRTARWRWSSTDWLSEGESFSAEIKGKHMYISCRKGGNQGKEEILKYDILDIRSVR